MCVPSLKNERKYRGERVAKLGVLRVVTDGVGLPPAVSLLRVRFFCITFQLHPGQTGGTPHPLEQTGDVVDRLIVSVLSYHLHVQPWRATTVIHGNGPPGCPRNWAPPRSATKAECVWRTGGGGLGPIGESKGRAKKKNSGPLVLSGRPE